MRVYTQVIMVVVSLIGLKVSADRMSLVVAHRHLATWLNDVENNLRIPNQSDICPTATSTALTDMYGARETSHSLV